MAIQAPAKGKSRPKVKEPFVHTFGEGEDAFSVTLPSLSYLKPGLVRKVRRLANIDAMYTVLEIELDADTLAQLDEVDPDDFEAMLDAWNKHSGINLGES